MAAIDQAQASAASLTPMELGVAKDAIRAAVWAWFDEHQNDVILRKWFFSFRLKDVRFVVEMIVGPE